MPTTPKDAQVSLRLPVDLKQRMEAYAQTTGRNKSHVVMEAVGEYLTWRSPQVDDLRAALHAADADDAFASEAEVAAVFARHLATQVPKRAGASRTLARKDATRKPKTRQS